MSFRSDPFASPAPARSNSGSSNSSVFGFSNDPFASSSAPASAQKSASDPFDGSPFGDFDSFAPTKAATPAKPLPAAGAAPGPRGDVANLLDF